MAPRSPFSDVPNGCFADIKSSSESRDGFVRILENDESRGGSQNGLPVTLANSRSVPDVSVSDVVGLTSEHKMIDVDAAIVVASMSNNFSCWNSTFVPNPNERADSPASVADSESGVSIRICIPRPFKTAASDSTALIGYSFKDCAAGWPGVSQLCEFDFGKMSFPCHPMTMPNLAGLIKSDMPVWH